MLDTYSSRWIRKLSRTDYLELYRSWVYACVSTIADDLSSLDYRLLDPKNNAIQHEYMKLITRDFLWYIVAYLKLNGSVYIRKIGDKTGRRIYALQLLRPDLMIPQWNSSHTKVERYLYSFGGNQTSFLPDELIEIHNFNPYEPLGMQSKWYGDVQAAALAIDMEYAGETRNRKFFENANFPGAILSSASNISAEEAERLEDAFNNKYKWVNNAHKLLVLGNGAKIERPAPGQKEADFVEQQRLSFEKILAIFKVPKAKLGMGEGVNVGNVKAFEVIFARWVIRPLAYKIAERLTQWLFKDIGTLEFLNVVPVDEAELRNDYMAGTITRNEYRVLTGMPRVQWGDSFIDGTEAVIEQEKQKEARSEKRVSATENLQKKIELAVKKSVYWSEDRAEARLLKKLERNDTYEKNYKTVVSRIWKLQQDDILKQRDKLNAEKAVKKIPTLNTTKRVTVRLSLLKPIQLALFGQEGDIAMQEVAPEKTFNAETEKMQRIAVDNIKRLAKSVDTETGKQIQKIIDTWLNVWLTPAQVRDKLQDYFVWLPGKRADMIVRSETIRAGTIAQQEAWMQSWVVEAKIRYTALDERVCEFCGPMHGQKVAIEEPYRKKWDEMTGQQWGSMKLDYRDTIGAPLHPNCRCDQIAVLK